MWVLQRGRRQQGVGVAAGGGLLLQHAAGQVDAAGVATTVGAAPRRAAVAVPLQYREATDAEAARWLAREVAAATEEMRGRQTTTR